MSLILQQIFNFFKLLNSETGHNQIAAGLALGFVMGLSPTLSLQTFLVFLIIFLFRVQAGAAFLSAFFFKFVGYLLDPVVDPLGRWVLELPSLRPLFVELYNMPIIPLTRFNNSIVMGSGVLALALSPVLFIISRQLILKYRVIVVAQMKDSKLWKAFAATSLYKWYNTYQSLYGK
jgi:uncharacterized protein (TIGR03546 family)